MPEQVTIYLRVPAQMEGNVETVFVRGTEYEAVQGAYMIKGDDGNVYVVPADNVALVELAEIPDESA